MNKQKLIFVGLIASFTILLGLSTAIVGKLYYDKLQINKLIKNSNKKLMEGNLALGKAKTELANAQNKKRELESDLRQQFRKYDEKITDYGTLEARYRKLKKAKGKTKVIYVDKPVYVHLGPDGKPVKHGLPFGSLYQVTGKEALKNIKELEGKYSDYHLEGKCNFTPKQDSLDIPFQFEYKLEMKFYGQIVKSTTPSGAINYYFNLWELDREGKRIEKLELTKFNMIVQDNQKKNFFFTPHVDFQIIGGLGLGIPPSLTNIHGQIGVAFGVSLFGYGKTKNDLLFRFLNISMNLTNGTSNNLLPGLGITIVQYNLGQIIPLISNFWLGPYIGINLRGNWYGGLSIGAML